MNGAWLLLLVMLAAPAGAAGSAAATREFDCSKRLHKDMLSEPVLLTGPRLHELQAPLYYVYVQAARDYRIYLRPRDVQATLKAMIEALNGRAAFRELAALSNAISDDLPLRDHTDLGKYALRGAEHRLAVQLLLKDMLTVGQASVVGDQLFAEVAARNWSANPAAAPQDFGYEKLQMYWTVEGSRVFCTADGIEVYSIFAVR